MGGFALNFLAGALEGVDKGVKKLEENYRQQQLLGLELVKSAPLGYRPRQKMGAFGPEWELESVGTADPRVQLQLQQQRAELEQRTAAEVAAFKTLNPLQSQSAKDLEQFRFDLQKKAQDRDAALEALVKSVATLPPPAALGQLDPALQAEALRPAQESYGRAALLAPDLAQRWAAMLPEAVRAGLQPAAAPGAPETGPQTPPNAGAPGPPPARSQAPQRPSAAPSSAAPGPRAQTPAPSQIESFGPEDVGAFLDEQAAQGVPPEKARTAAVLRLNEAQSALRSVAVRNPAVGALGGVLSAQEVRDVVDREIQARSQRKQSALAEEKAGAELAITRKEAGVVLTLPDIAEAASAPLQGEHTDADPFYLSISEEKGHEGEQTPVPNADAISASRFGDAPAIRKIREASQKLALAPEELQASLGRNEWGARSLQRLKEFRFKSDKSGVVAEASAQRIELTRDGLRLFSPGDVAQAESRGRRLVPLRNALGIATEPQEAGLTPRGLAEHLWLGSTATGSGLKRAPSIAVVHLPAKLDPEVALLVSQQNEFVRDDFERLGVPLPKGNVLLLDLASYYGEGR